MSAPLTAALQGERGSFSHVAARQALGEEVAVVPCRTFDDLMEAVVQGEARWGLVPVENTLAGSVPRNLDRIRESRLSVVAETTVRVELCLVAPAGVGLDEVDSAASHPVALEQCRGFFQTHPHIEPRSVYDTAGSVRELMAGRAEYGAAIGSELAARLYGAGILIRGIEDDPRNHTRFYVVSPEPSPMPDEGPVKAVMAFVVAHRPGSLYRALGVVAREGADLSRLESRPIPGRPWEYRFYADVRGEAEAVGRALEGLRAEAGQATVLGAFRDPWPARGQAPEPVGEVESRVQA
jgi:prephenate dehydratase